MPRRQKYPKALIERGAPGDPTRLLADEGVPRRQVQPLMRDNGIQGAKRRGRPWRTTRPGPSARRRPDLVQRDFTAEEPNRPRVGDLSYRNPVRLIPLYGPSAAGPK